MTKNIQEITIVGGGTAGWMAANLLLNKWPSCKINLVESKDIGSIGVGEGSTPYLKTFFRSLGISDGEWMPQCNATYKAGIRFPGWSSMPGYGSYFHPFYSQLDLEVGKDFFHQCNEKRRGGRNSVHPDHYFVANQIAAQGLAPVPVEELPFEIDYGYHFDSLLLGKFLKEKALNEGLIHLIDNVQGVELGDQGEIEYVVTDKCGKIGGDFFLDCTGFRGILVNKAYSIPFVSFSDSLFNDAAVTVATDIDKKGPLRSETLSTALNSGWAWKIPLTNRYGNGYVYSSQFLEKSEAEAELLKHLELEGEEDLAVRHIKIRVGRLQEHWHKNCLAVGLSQGFVEPLEATTLMLIQYTVENFIARYDPCKPILDNAQEGYNDNINQLIDGIRDYIVAHYKLNTRTDTTYWKECREDAVISDTLAAILHAWDNGLDVDQELSQRRHKLSYLRPSWYVILSGMGRFPSAGQAPKDQSCLQASSHCKSLAKTTFRDHWLQLSKMARLDQN